MKRDKSIRHKAVASRWLSVDRRSRLDPSTSLPSASSGHAGQAVNGLTLRLRSLRLRSGQAGQAVGREGNFRLQISD